MSQTTLVSKPKPAVQKPKTTAISQKQQLSNKESQNWSYGVPLGSLGQPRDAFWGSLGRPWGAPLGNPLGPLGAPKGRPSHMGQKRNRHTKKHPPFGALLAPKWLPRVPKWGSQMTLFRPKRPSRNSAWFLTILGHILASKMTLKMSLKISKIDIQIMMQFVN